MPMTLERSQVGKREWLSDYITITDAKEKPLLAMIKKGERVVNTLHRWQADAYEDPATGGIVDGVDITDSDYENAAANRKELKVYCQKSRRSAKVSEMAEDISRVAGASEGEFSRSIRKKLEELGRDIEATLCSDNDTVADDGSDAYKTRGLGSWIQNGAQSTFPVDSDFRTPAASIDSTAMASLTESTFKDVLKSVFEQRGRAQDLTLLCGTDLKKTITGFTQFASGTNQYASVKTYNQQSKDRSIISNVTVYEGDFNRVTLHPSLLLASGTSDAPSRRGYVLDMSMLELNWNKHPQVNRLPDLDGGPRAVVKAIYAMTCKNPLGLGKFAATS
jgi:rhodanese-related sulfurtransferase